MTPSPTPSEGEAMLALAARCERCANCRSSELPSELLREAAKTLRAAAQSSGVREDSKRLDFLESWARKSRTGISFDWVPSVEGEPSGFRFMRRHNIGEPKVTLRLAIDAALSPDTPREGEK